jgi:hypothetical protein
MGKYDEVLQTIDDAQAGIQQIRPYHLRAALTELEGQFKPDALAAKLLTEQFGRLIRTHTEYLIKRLGRAIQVNPELNSDMEAIQPQLADAIDLVGHQIIKRHFNEAFDRAEETLKMLRVRVECLSRNED